MLKQRILSTLGFFDLQDYPLTILELRRFLLRDIGEIKQFLDQEYEIKDLQFSVKKGEQPVLLSDIYDCLEIGLRGEVEEFCGFYFLAGRKNLAVSRMRNYEFGIWREKLIKRYAKYLKYIPFVRGVALGGSQALGKQAKTSDIDLFIVTHKNFMYLARTLVTLFFQVLALRRHGKKIQNRFCLNHYVAGVKKIDALRNLYSAMEYARLRPLFYKQNIAGFQAENAGWIQVFFPNWQPASASLESSPWLQRTIENFLQKTFGFWLEAKLKAWQQPKFKREKFVIIKADELSFHPESKQDDLLGRFFKYQ